MNNSILDDLLAQVDDNLDLMLSEGLGIVESLLADHDLDEKRKRYYLLKHQLLESDSSPNLREFLNLVTDFLELKSRVSYLTGLSIGIRFQETVVGQTTDLFNDLIVEAFQTSRASVLETEMEDEE